MARIVGTHVFSLNTSKKYWGLFEAGYECLALKALREEIRETLPKGAYVLEWPLLETVKPVSFDGQLCASFVAHI